jgi:hypothetical protein
MAISAISLHMRMWRAMRWAPEVSGGLSKVMDTASRPFFVAVAK